MYSLLRVSLYLPQTRIFYSLSQTYIIWSLRLKFEISKVIIYLVASDVMIRKSKFVSKTWILYTQSKRLKEWELGTLEDDIIIFKKTRIKTSKIVLNNKRKSISNIRRHYNKNLSYTFLERKEESKNCKCE